MTFNESDVQFANRNDEDSARKIDACCEMQGAGVVVQGGETRSERNAGYIVLD